MIVIYRGIGASLFLGGTTFVMIVLGKVLPYGKSFQEANDSLMSPQKVTE